MKVYGEGFVSSKEYMQVGCGFEQTISRILYLWGLTNPQGAIIYPGRELPRASSDQPEG